MEEWSAAGGQSNAVLLQSLLASAPVSSAGSLALPDWPALHTELGRKSVTLRLLRQVQVPGEKLFVDWAGQTVPIHNAQDGSVGAGHLFVAAMEASNRIHTEAFANEQLPHVVRSAASKP